MHGLDQTVMFYHPFVALDNDSYIYPMKERTICKCRLAQRQELRKGKRKKEGMRRKGMSIDGGAIL